VARAPPYDPPALPLRALRHGYCAFRIIDDLLRVDSAALMLGVRCNLLLASAGTAIGLTWFVHTQRGALLRRPSPR
jgi:hypothetical protein